MRFVSAASQPHEPDLETAGNGVVALTKTTLCNEPDINKDGLFLDSMAKLLEIETSEFFLGHLRKFQNAYTEARRSVKKRIENKSNETTE